MKERRSVVYVNFAPYDNAGKILHYIKTTFPLIVHFSFDFHKLNNSNQSNVITVYREGKIVKTVPMRRLPTTESLLFIFLPLISLFILFQIPYYLIKLKREFGSFDLYLTVNAFTAWIGNICRKAGLIKKTIFWVWDYYPPKNPDWRIRFARYGYWKFDKLATKASDKVVFLNKRLEFLRKKIGVLSGSTNHQTVPIGTDPVPVNTTNKRLVIGHLGVIKRSQGLDFLFDNVHLLHSFFPDAVIEIVGSGPDEKYFRARGKKYKKFVKFYGYIKDDTDLSAIMSRWTVGIAPYMPGDNHVSYWTDPSKVKAYLSHGIPVVTTSVIEFAKEIKKYRAGVIVEYDNGPELLSGIRQINALKNSYKRRALQLAKKYDYQNLYAKLFR